MGLDLVEFVLAVEDAFEIAVPDADAGALTTPLHVINFLAQHLAARPTNGTVVTQRAFYRTRAAIARTYSCNRRDLKPATRLTTNLPAQNRKLAWLELRAALGARHWPEPPSDRLWSRLFATPRTVGELAQYLVAHSPTQLLKPGERWTRQQIEEVVRQLVEYHFGLRRDQYTLDSRFVQDLHID